MIRALLVIIFLSIVQLRYSSGQCDSLYSEFIDSCYGYTFYFDNVSGGDIYRYEYDFGDGSGDTLPNTTHTYTIDGSYNVCLSVFDTCQNSSTQCVMLSTPIQGKGGCRSSSDCPHIIHSFTDTCIYTSVKFIGQSNNPVDKWYWDFGDGHSDSIQSPTHLYTTPGIYEVCLVVIDSCGDSANYCKDVRVVGYRCWPISVNEHSSDDKIKVYPNPSNSQICIRSFDNQSNEISVQIFSPLGKLIYLNQNFGDTECLNVGNWPKGIYFILINLEDNLFKKTILIE